MQTILLFSLTCGLHLKPVIYYKIKDTLNYSKLKEMLGKNMS